MFYAHIRLCRPVLQAAEDIGVQGVIADVVGSAVRVLRPMLAIAGERKAQQDIANIHQWAGTIRQYLDLQELNREIIEELIDRIEVGERTVIDGQRHQDIKIYYRFVGLV